MITNLSDRHGNKKVIKPDDIPGHLFRRLHQFAVMRFNAELDETDLTPIQWAAMMCTRGALG
jgi:hypothetical protein